MFQYEDPSSLQPHELDAYLSKGWYRAGQSIFTLDTCNFEDGDGHTYVNDKVYWLRVSMAQFSFSRGQKQLLRTNESFTVELSPCYISGEIEWLFRQYKSAINFRHSQSVREFLQFGGNTNVFDTYLITVRNGEALIAAGYFDNAENSIAGILSFYHPDYRKCSLGKFLLLKKAEYARALGKHYFYLGYIARAYAKFNYKLFAPEATEVFHFSRQEWLPFHNFPFH